MGIRCALLLSFTWLALACGDSGGDDDEKPEVPSEGSSRGDAQQELCDPFEACGGDVVGSWEVAAVCFENPETFITATMLYPACADAVRSGTARAAGRYQFDEDGKETIDLRLELDLDTLWTYECLAVLADDDTLTAAELCDVLEQQYVSDPEIAGASCELDGDECACLISTVEMSEMRVDEYQPGADTVGSSPFCVDGDTLRISMTSMGLTGTIVLHRE